MLKERRFAVRYPYSLAVHVQGEAGEPFPAQTTEMSLQGVGLLVSREVVLALAQGGAILSLGDRLDVLAPDPEGVATTAGLPFRVRVQQVRRVSQQRYHVGVVFDALDAEQEARLEALVAQAREGGVG